MDWGPGFVWEDLSRIRTQGGLLFVAVDSAGTLGLAGMRAGDRIEEIRGRRLRDHPGDYARLQKYGTPGDSAHIAWIRESETFRGVAVLQPNRLTRSRVLVENRNMTPVSLATMAWISQGPPFLTALLGLVAGILVGLMRRRNTTAHAFALLLLCFGIVQTPPEGAGAIATWPLWLTTVAIAASVVPYAAIGVLMARVLATFPYRSRLGSIVLRWQWLILIPYACWAIGEQAASLAAIHPRLQSTAEALAFLRAGSRWGFLSAVIVVASLLVAQRIEMRSRPQTRLRIIEAGLVLWIAGGLLYCAAGWSQELPIHSAVARWILFNAAWFCSTILLLAGGIVMVYGVLARRVFGLQFAIRRGLQHLLLSRGVLAFEAFLFFLVLMAVLRGSGARVAESVPLVGGIAASTTALGIIGLRRVNRPLMSAIDRRFFTESYDVRRVLGGLGHEIANLTAPDVLMDRVSAVVLATLHPARLAFLLHSGDGSLEVRRVEEHPRPAQGAWAQGASGLDVQTIVAEPLTKIAPEDRWLDIAPSNAATEETEQPAAAPFELLVPLRAGGELLGAMAFGPKLSEEPYSREDKDLLSALASQAALVLKNAELLEVARREAQQTRDIEIARRVQQSLFPRNLPQVPGWEFAGLCRPARAVGGDYYDVFEVGQGQIAVALGDVSGKGLGASLLMANLHALMRSRLPHRIGDLSTLMSELNEELVISTPGSMFVTLFVGVVDTASGVLRYANAGHPPPMLVRAGRESPVAMTEAGMMAGMISGATFPAAEAVVASGESVVIYSDGVTEAMDGEGGMFDEEGLVSALGMDCGASAESLLTRVLDAVDGFVAGAEQADDISLVVVRRTGPQSG